MNKAEYIASQVALGKTHSQIIAEQPTETVQGSLLAKHYHEIKTILASGLRLHINTFNADTVEKAAALAAVNETFTEQFLASADFKVNFNVEAVFNQFQFCIQVGALPKVFADQLINLAKYEKPIYSITSDDFIGEWQELPASDSRELTLKLNAKAPEQTHVLVQAQDQYADGSKSDWYHATALHGIELVRVYKSQLPHNGYARKIRWRCEYVLDCEVSL